MNTVTRIPITCTSCQRPLTGNIDTFGDVDLPLCWNCWSELVFTHDEHVDLRAIIAGEVIEGIGLDPELDEVRIE